MNNKVDFNNNECIKSYSNIGSTTYVNICNNETTSVPWGSGEWVGYSLVAIALIVFIVAIIAMIIDTIRN